MVILPQLMYHFIMRHLCALSSVSAPSVECLMWAPRSVARTGARCGGVLTLYTPGYKGCKVRLIAHHSQLRSRASSSEQRRRSEYKCRVINNLRCKFISESMQKRETWSERIEVLLISRRLQSSHCFSPSYISRLFLVKINNTCIVHVHFLHITMHVTVTWMLSLPFVAPSKS